MINSCNQVCSTPPVTSYNEPPAQNAADTDPEAEANAVIAEFGQRAVSDATGTTYATALAGLHDNYA